MSGDGDTKSKAATIDYKPGDVVLTLYGVGVIVATRSVGSPNDTHPDETAKLTPDDSSPVEDSFVSVRLWRIPGRSLGSSALATLKRSTLLEKLPAAPGMQTTLKSTSRTTTETASSTARKPVRVQVHCYYADRRTYLVSRIGHPPSPPEVEAEATGNLRKDEKEKDPAFQANEHPLSPASTTGSWMDLSIANSRDEDTALSPSLPTTQQENNALSSNNNNLYTEEVAVDQIHPAVAAKFYPVLQALMVRAEETAIATSKLLQSQQTKDFVSTLSTQTERVVAAATSSSSSLEGGTVTAVTKNIQSTVASATQGVSRKLEELAATAQSQAPQVDENIQQVLQYVKDEQITDLLQDCKQRLHELRASSQGGKDEDGNSLLSAATKQGLARVGVQFQESMFSDQVHTITTTASDSTNPDGTRIVRFSEFTKSMQESRKVALSALEELLQSAQAIVAQQREEGSDANPNDPKRINIVEATRHELSTNFSKAFDSLATAAKSDRDLNDLFESISAKTTVWQSATGRLLQTKSASLFLQGATHLQARAKDILEQHHIFGKNNNKMNGGGFHEVGSKLTKSFTEGDAALARLKSIELGDTVKNRLVDAIQVRSEALGGLDGIIAGALSMAKEKGLDTSAFMTTVSDHTAKLADVTNRGSHAQQLQALLTTLQQNSTTATTNAHETLIAVLSSRSKYRDAALLRIESVFCDLEGKIGEHVLSPEEIAALVSGEGGTAKIFEPIAKRAKVEIDKQLDAAEAQVTDETVLGVLQRVRKIMSGELTVDAIMDDLASFLNDEKIVAAGETIVLQSEHVLDALENATGNRKMVDALQIAEKVGITKDSVMKEFEKLNVDQLLDTAGSVVTDEKTRRKVISSATDAALDFVLRILPSIPVPPFEGVKDGLIYHISNLSMEGFRVRKEDIQLELAGMRATKRRRREAVTAPLSSDSGIDISRGMRTASSFDSTESSATVEIVEVTSTPVKATELLVIDVRNISAIFENASWSFEQTYLPYLKGDGTANVHMSGGAIRLQFELRKQRKRKGTTGSKDEADPADMEWEPVLCLHDRSCSISDVELNLGGEGKITWVLNKLASILKGPLRDYVVKTIVNVLSTQSGIILENMNKILAPYWGLILSTAKLSLSDLTEADDDVIKQSAPQMKVSLVELVWRERLPLGMNLLMNDDSGLLKVVDFPRGSQARAVCEKRNMDPDLFKGARVVSVNGTEYEDQEDLFDALREPGRPKTVSFYLAASEDAEKVRKFVAGETDDSDLTYRDDEEGNSESEDTLSPRIFPARSVHFREEGELGLQFADTLDDIGIMVSGFVQGEGGIVFAAERSGQIKIGDLVTQINGEAVLGRNGTGRTKALELFEGVGGIRPLTLSLMDPYMFRTLIDKQELPKDYDSGDGPSEMVLVEKQIEIGVRRIRIRDFRDVCGAAESSGIFIGDHLVFINGFPVGAGCSWMNSFPAPDLEEVRSMLMNEQSYPMGLTFARPRQSSSRWTGSNGSSISDSQCDTICVTVMSKDELGFVLDNENGSEVIVSDFEAVPGTFQRALNRYREDGRFFLSIESVNGQFVPSYASKEMVKNAINRSWKSTGRVELLLCDDDRKAWVDSLF